MGLYFLLAHGILQPARARGPIDTDVFWERLALIGYEAEKEGIQTRGSYEADPPYFAIPVADTQAICGRALAIQMLDGRTQEDRYAVQLQAYPQLVLNALGNDRPAIETNWTRIIFLASNHGIILPIGQWLFINEFD